MSLARKDVRFKADEADHHDLVLVAEIDGMDIGEWVETVVMKEVRRRIEVATVLATRRARRGKTGSGGE